jgi:thioredoxin-like negative regulator of GroEL
MTSLTLSVILQASIVAAAPGYEQAYHQSTESGKPLVVLVGADWCPACQTMKTSIMPALQRRGALKDVAFAVVNTDHQSSLANRLMTGGSIPQLILYHKTDKGWKRKQITGATSESAVMSFINSAVDKSKVASLATGE